MYPEIRRVSKWGRCYVVRMAIFLLALPDGHWAVKLPLLAVAFVSFDVESPSWWNVALEIRVPIFKYRSSIIPVCRNPPEGGFCKFL